MGWPRLKGTLVIKLTSPSQPPHSSLPTRPKGWTAPVGSLGLLSIIAATLTGCSAKAAAATPAATVAVPAASPTPAPGVCGYMPLEPSASPTLGPSLTPAPVTVTYTSQWLAYAVTSVGPADITYGTDSINDRPPGGLGSLGTGTAIPWYGSLPYGPNANALYYVVTAQLDGSGDITCACPWPQSRITATTRSTPHLACWPPETRPGVITSARSRT
jgi:hypothetical protein